MKLTNNINNYLYGSTFESKDGENQELEKIFQDTFKDYPSKINAKTVKIWAMSVISALIVTVGLLAKEISLALNNIDATSLFVLIPLAVGMLYLISFGKWIEFKYGLKKIAKLSSGKDVTLRRENPSLIKPCRLFVSYNGREQEISLKGDYKDAMNEFISFLKSA